MTLFRLMAVVLSMLLLVIPAFSDQRVVTRDLGVFHLPPNLDDDDENKVPDSLDFARHPSVDDDDLVSIRIPHLVSAADVRIEGAARKLIQLVGLRNDDSGGTRLYFGATGCRNPHHQARVVVTVSGTEFVATLDIAPFVLMSSLSRPSRVFVVDAPFTDGVQRELKRILKSVPGSPELTVIRVPKGDPIDVWIQDATEIGVFQGTRMTAALRGLRSGHYDGSRWSVNAAPLDDYFASVFLGSGSAMITVGNPLPLRKWIDWYGNLEVTPPHRNRRGVDYPAGRALMGKQGRLQMHSEILAFLRKQGMQWPPVVLDTSFLMIGHVDEIINFVPAGDGYRILCASPRLGESLLRKMDEQGYGNRKLLEGRRTHDDRAAEVTVRSLLSNKPLLAANRRAAAIMDKNIRHLVSELGCNPDLVVEIPLLFSNGGTTVWPNVLNALVLGNRIICPKPFGPVISGEDLLETHYTRIFESLSMVPHFIDAFDGYSRMAGEIHCGTNATRHQDP